MDKNLASVTKVDTEYEVQKNDNKMESPRCFILQIGYCIR